MKKRKLKEILKLIEEFKTISPKLLAEPLKVTNTRAWQILNELEKEGLVAKIKTGEYQLTEKGIEVLNTTSLEELYEAVKEDITTALDMVENAIHGEELDIERLHKTLLRANSLLDEITKLNSEQQ